MSTTFSKSTVFQYKRKIITWAKEALIKEEFVYTSFSYKKLIPNVLNLSCNKAQANMHLGLTNSLHTPHCLAQVKNECFCTSFSFFMRIRNYFRS